MTEWSICCCTWHPTHSLSIPLAPPLGQLAAIGLLILTAQGACRRCAARSCCAAATQLSVPIMYYAHSFLRQRLTSENGSGDVRYWYGDLIVSLMVPFGRGLLFGRGTLAELLITHVAVGDREGVSNDGKAPPCTPEVWLGPNAAQCRYIFLVRSTNALCPIRDTRIPILGARLVREPARRPPIIPD